MTSIISQIAREAARQQRRAEAEHRRLLREMRQRERAYERETAAARKEAKQRYLESRLIEAEDANEQVETVLADLANVLNHTLSVDDALNFDSLLVDEPYPPFVPPSDLVTPLECPSEEDFTRRVWSPGFLGKVLPALGRRYQRRVGQAIEKFAVALDEYDNEQQRRAEILREAESRYKEAMSEHDARIAGRNKEMLEFKAAYLAGDPKAVVGYCSMVLERSDYPEGCPQEFRAAYSPESKQLVLEYQLPLPDIVPSVAEYGYVRTKDQIQEKARKPSEIRDIYQDVIAAITLRTIHELFEADRSHHVLVIVFSGFVQTVDPATGRDTRRFLISVRATRDQFEQIDLARVDKRVCLRNLGAQVSARPSEVQPVKPLVEFDMVDKRFVEQSDVLADLESRPNLMDLNPYEFENLVCQLFALIGLETKLTRSSRDGGVDVVAYDARPVLGGKVVIQAKRYRYTVGVAAVRDLFGTMMNEGANKGILVTTSGYGPDAFEFAKDKPIELIDGGQLLYLLDQQGVKARIVFPQEDADLRSV